MLSNELIGEKLVQQQYANPSDPKYPHDQELAIRYL